jgi:hypothetical protein
MNNRKQLWELIYRTTRVMVETQAAAHLTHVIKNRTADDGLIHSLNEKRLSPYLITEEFSDEDANKLEAAVQELTKIVDDMGKKLTDAGMDGTAEALITLAGDIPDTGNIAGLAIKGETEELQKQTGEINEKLSEVQEAVALIVSSLSELGTNLGNFEAKLDDEQKEKTIQELSEDDELVKAGNFVSTKDLEAGVGKVFKVPGWFEAAVSKGMSAAKGAKDGGVMGFFKGLFGGGGGKKKSIDQKLFTQDVLKTPFGKFLEISKAMEGAQGPLEAAIGGSAEAGATAQAAVGAPGEEAPAGEVEDPDKKEKRPGFDLLGYIEKNAPELFKRLKAKAMGEDDEEVQGIDAAVETGQISPEEAAEDLKGEAGKLSAADAMEALKTALTPDDEALEKFGLPDDADWGEALASKAVGAFKEKGLVDEALWHDPTLEYLLEARRVALLLEQEEGGLTADIITDFAGEAIQDNETHSGWVAWKMFTALKDAGMEIEGDVPEPGEPGEEEAAGKASEEDEAAAEEAAEAAGDAAESGDMSPIAGVDSIVQAWATSTKSLQKSISGKQTDTLKKAAVDVVGKAQEMVVTGLTDAVDAWRGTQKVLQKPHTSDKQIEILKTQLADFVKTIITIEEAVRPHASARMERRLRDKMTQFLLEATDIQDLHLRRLDTWSLLETFAIAFCDMWVDNEPTVIVESDDNAGYSYSYDHVDPYDEDELVRHKWMRMAGLPGF